MTAPIVAFFNNRVGFERTFFVYHLVWMYTDLGLRVLAADLDPQANLTAAFVDAERLEELWEDGSDSATVFAAIRPLLRGTGDVVGPQVLEVEPSEEGLGLLCGDLSLSELEDELAAAWPACLDGKERSFRVISAFWRILEMSSRSHDADVVLVDLGPNLGAINRAALVAADYLVIPLSPDLFSLQGLRNLGPTLRKWRREWSNRLARRPSGDLALPEGRMEPLGYVVLQHSVRLDRPVKAYERWIARIPDVYREAVLEAAPEPGVSVSNDPFAIALLKHYRSLMPMAQEARKPMFHLKPADGAIGSHGAAAQAAYHDFRDIALSVAERIGLEVPRIAVG